MNKTLEKTSFAALSAMPFVVAALVGATPLREAGLHVPVGAVAFALIAAAVFLLVRRSAAPWEDRRELITAGVLFIVPFSLFALLWVGMATPYHTTPAENLLRYEVLVIGAIAVSCAFLFLFRIVSKRCERYLATLFLGISMLAGAAYLTWHCFHAGMWLIRIKNDIVTPHVADMTAIFDAYIFFATILTFVATALRRSRWRDLICCRVELREFICPSAYSAQCSSFSAASPIPATRARRVLRLMKYPVSSPEFRQSPG